MKKPPRPSKLALASQTVRTLETDQLAHGVGGALDPNPKPSLKVSCSGSRYC